MSELEVTCQDCGAPYGKDGWCDVVIPDEVWNVIDPDSGVLCFRCMTKRLIEAGFDSVPVIVASGPYVDANETWRLIGWEHGHKVCREEKTARELALEDLLRSAHAIAARNGENTAWDRFAASIRDMGIGSVTARVYKVLPSDNTD